jgi:PAS domain S-box-containing protein
MAEEKLRESEARFRKVFEQGRIGISIVGLDGRFLDVNPALCKILGYSARELRDMAFSDVTHPDEVRRDVGKIMAMSRGTLSEYSVEKRYIRKDGKTIWVTINASLVRDSDGKPQHVVTLTEDITEKKAADDRLVESENRERQLLDFLPDSTFALDLDGKVTLWNKAMASMSGIGADRMLGKGSSEIGLHFYGRRRPIAAELVLRPGQRMDVGYDSIDKVGDLLLVKGLVPRLIRGKPGYAWILAKPIHDAKGEIVGVIESVRDVTEQKRNELELIQQKEKVEALSSARERFIADMTHELKTPLSVIMLHLDMMRKHERLAPDAVQSYAMMWRNALRMGRSIDQIMELTNLKSVHLHTENFKLNDLVLAVVEDYLPLSKSKGITLSAKGPEMGMVCDMHLLSLIISNLISNAVKFTEKGSIIISWRRSGSGAVISVSDTGIGISTENKDKVFGKFYKENPDAPGSGIGLSLSLELVKKMGGTITVKSKKHRGSEFIITIPTEGNDEKDTDNRG